MGKIIKRVMILAGIFLAAVGIYFIASQKSMEKSEAVFTAMAEPTLPVVYMDMYETESSRLVGYRQEMEQTVSRETLTVLPEDRQLCVRVKEYGSPLLKVQYEIRSMDLNRLVERTTVEYTESADGESRMVLPIQNLLTRGTEYLLHLTLETEKHGELHYYTRILWPETDYGQQMMALAREFSQKSLSAEQAKDLVTYLETSDTADNSSLGHVSIKSSFSQLTWAGLSMELAGDMHVSLTDLDGVMGQVCVFYQVSRNSENGETELYDVTDYYTMKWSAKRIYMMDFDRVTNQVFSGARSVYSGKRILLGIGNDEAIDLVKSADKQQLAFVFNRDLWIYDQQDGKAVKVFSFRSNADSSGRSDYGNHDIKVLSLDNEGNMDFLVYGYMNRGPHEGYQGISLYHYDHSGAIEERFFIPSEESFGEIRLDVEKMAYLNDSGMLYLFRDQAVFALDLSSNEYMVVADGLIEGCYAISQDGKKVAWQEGQDPYGAQAIHIFDMTTGATQEIRCPEGDLVRCLGFVQQDFVYGLAKENDLWVLNGRTEDLPMYAIEIVDGNLVQQTRYEKAGYYILNVEVESARIHMDRYGKRTGQGYEYLDNDTIVCNTAVEEVYMDGIGWFASEIRRKVYFVQLDSEVKSNRSVKISVAKKLSSDESEILTLKTNSPYKNETFYAYGQGQFLGTYEKFADAVGAAYEEMGIVTDSSQRILWSRVNRETIRTIRNPQDAAYEMIRNVETLVSGKAELENGMTLIDARGCTLSQMLYFIDKGCPVIAYTQEGNMLLLYGYDQYNVSVLNLETGETYKMGLNDGADYFELCRNDFISAVVLKH